MVAVLPYRGPGLGQQTSPALTRRIAPGTVELELLRFRATRQMSALGRLPLVVVKVPKATDTSHAFGPVSSTTGDVHGRLDPIVLSLP
jgi:hypothetical protein